MEANEDRKIWQICLIVVVSVLCNYGGKCFAAGMQLPMWLDSLGTVTGAWFLGPFWGAVIGLSSNVIYGLQDSTAFVYSLTAIAIGVSAGYYARRNVFDSLFDSISLSVRITLLSVVISTPLNLIFYDGMTGNIWGDGVTEYLMEQGRARYYAAIVGEFYVDFVDKLLTILLLYLVIRLWRYRKKAACLLLAVGVGAALTAPMQTRAEDTSEEMDVKSLTSYVQRTYSSDSGLPCGGANTIAQTRDGVLWIGTYAGLYRYNGEAFELRGEYRSVKNVNCLYSDQQGRLWIGTNDSGISVSENEEIVCTIDEELGLPSNSVRSITQSADGLFYVGTSDEMQVLQYDGEVKLLGVLPEIKYATSLSADQNGYVAATTSAGDVFLMKDGKIVYSTSCGGMERFTCCSFSPQGYLLVGTSGNQIYSYFCENGNWKMNRMRSSEGLHDLNYIYFSRDGRIYICADNGIGYFLQEDFSVINTRSFDNSVDSMTVDYQGNLWFASSRKGVMCLCESDFTELYALAGMENRVVNSMTFWKGMMYVGTDSGLDVLDVRHMRPLKNRLVKALDGFRIRCVKVDSKNRLWICTYGDGLWLVDEETVTKFNSENSAFGNRARTVLELSDGRMMVSGDLGVAYIDDGKVTQTMEYGEELPDCVVLTLSELADHSVLAGTDGDGLVQIRNGKVEKIYDRKDGLSSGVILRTVRDPQGNGNFIVTSNNISYMEEDGSIRALDSFPYFNNYDICPGPDGKLYVLGSAGIYVVDRNELLSGNYPEYEILDSKSGLTSALTANSWNYRDGDDNLFLSTDSGVFLLDMRKNVLADRECRARVRSVKMNDAKEQRVDAETISVPRNVKKLEIIPEIINFTTKDPYVSYKLEGFDRAETLTPYSSLGSIVYTNLPAGKYVFHLRIWDRNRSVVLNECSYIVDIEMKIYDYPWFSVYLLSVMALAVAWLTWFFVRSHIQRTVNFQKKELELARSQIEMGNQTILAIARTVDAKDVNTAHHSQRVAEYSVLISKRLGMSEDEQETLRQMALLHDIGKIGVSDSVLNKAGKLSEEEYAEMKTHVTIGAEILRDFTLIDHVWIGALYHHERYDGGGYAEGLSGEKIPIEARIIGVADAFDAMTAHRVYRRKLSKDVVLSELHKGRGTQFDPHILDILLQLIAEKEIDIDLLCAEDE